MTAVYIAMGALNLIPMATHVLSQYTIFAMLTPSEMGLLASACLPPRGGHRSPEESLRLHRNADVKLQEVQLMPTRCSKRQRRVCKRRA